MSDDFVDFFEILELPLDAERSEVRKRIGELYVEAQKNLDHRNFDTRVRNQQLFEITLPQARYILLNDGRRDEYTRLVTQSRGLAGAPAQANAPAGQADSARVKNPAPGTSQTSSNRVAGVAPSIDALPDESRDPQAVEREREELWNKWKSGLQSAMERESAKEKSRPADIAPTPLADRIEAVQTGAPQPLAGAPASSASASAKAQKSKSERPKVKFDFGGAQEKIETPERGERAPASETEESVETAQIGLTPAQIQGRRDDHRREIMRDELENTGLKALFIGAGLILIPGIVAMTAFMITYYPTGKESVLAIKSVGLAWILWILILAGLAYGCGRILSKSLRRRQGMTLSKMNYEQLIRHTNKDM